MNPYLLTNIKQKYLPKLIDYTSTFSLMEKLPHRSQVICALEAAKMVLPIWEKYTSKTSKILIKEQKAAPKKGIETIENWLAGKATIKEAIKTAELVFDSASRLGLGSSFVPARASANAIGHAIFTIYYKVVAAHHIINTNNEAISAIVATSIRSMDRNLVEIEFYNEWWGRCSVLLEHEFQNEYDILCKQINGNL